jgi:hypothetical protein
VISNEILRFFTRADRIFSGRLMSHDETKIPFSRSNVILKKPNAAGTSGVAGDRIRLIRI